MARQNVPLLAFNRGLVSPKALARVDLDRTRLSAEVMTNWLPKTQGAMTLRPGTKYFGSSHHDTGAEWIEFVASTDQVALLEITDGRMRIWQGDDAHSLALLTRENVSTTVSLTDTGWTNASTGGAVATAAVDIIPTMTGETTSNVKMTASSSNAIGSGVGGRPWNAADDNTTSAWTDTGAFYVGGTLPSWLNVDFDAAGTDTGNRKSVRSYSIRNYPTAPTLDNAPKAWRLIAGNFDTGTFATDTGKWTLQDERSAQQDWGAAEKRTFSLLDADTGTVEKRRHWRLLVTQVDTGAGDASGEVLISEIEMFDAAAAQQVKLQGGARVLNATAIGSLAKATKRVIISDTGTEHSLAINVSRGPITLRVGSTDGNDDYISETQLGTGHHSLAFTPTSNFWITLQSDVLVDRIVSSLTIGDSGIVSVEAPWAATDLANIRYDQSADVVFVDCDGVHPQKIERRGTGRSWSVVEYEPDDGPFLTAASSSATLTPGGYYGNTTLTASVPFFTPEHVGALFRVFTSGQSGQWPLGAKEAATDAIKVTGLSDTGTSPTDDTGYSERNIQYRVSGVYTGTITIEKSLDGPDFGFKPISSNIAAATDTGTFVKNMVDRDDNVTVYYRARMSAYTSGAAIVTAIYKQGGINGVARVTSFNSNLSVEAEVLSRFSDTGPTSSWQEGFWSDHRGFPTAVALHGGRLGHAEGGNIYLSVADDYESFNPDEEGDAAPIIRTLGSGPVDSIRYLVSLLRLIIGTAGAELTMRSSSLDEPLTPANSNAASFGTQGSANLRALKMDNRAIFVQRSLKRLFMVGAGTQSTSTFGDYEEFELTLLVPDLLAAGVVSVALQRQPDTRIHCALADGRVGILTYEPSEEVICWSIFETDGAVERVMVLPGEDEDAVYYHVRRTIGGANDSFTKILLHFEGTDGSTSIVDDAAGASSTHIWTAAGNAQLDQPERKFGQTSALFDGTGDYFSTDDTGDFALGSSDFTVDFWFNCTEPSGRNRRACGHTDPGGNANASSFYIERSTANVMRAFLSNGTAFTTVTGTTQFTDVVNTGWHHVAFVRSSNTLRLFVDGTQEASTTFSASVQDCSSDFSVGTRNPSSGTPDPWLGWIDEFRLSVGVARWTANFTPPNHATPPTSVRYLEKWAMESECEGDTGLTWLMDSAKSFTDTGRTTALTGYEHLAGKAVVVWGDDTGSIPGVDYSPDVAGTQTTYTVDTGQGTFSLATAVHHAVAGLPFTADWKSTKLAYAAEAGTALAQMKRTDKIAFVLYKTHNNGVFFGSDSGHLDPLPRVSDAGAAVDADKIYETFDQAAMPFPGLWDADSRIHVRGKSPRPATVLAIIPTVNTSEKV